MTAVAAKADNGIVARYRISNIAGLARQMTFAPPGKRLAQIRAAEDLLHSLDRGKGYPFDFVVYRITGYRPKSGGDDLLTGLALQHDLGLLIERVSDSLNVQAAALGEPVLTIDDVTERFNVTSKTIQRWRRRGLPARRFIFPDGKRRVGFLVSSVERFFALHRTQIDCHVNFATVDRDEHAAILRNARRLAENCRCAEADIARRIARRTNRAPLAILHTLRRHDAENPQHAILNDLTPALDVDDRARILRSWRRGSSIAELSSRLACTRAAIARAVLDERAGRLDKRRVKFIDDPLYHGRGAHSAINQIVAQEELSSAPRSAEETRIPRDLPAYLQELYRTPLLSPNRERTLFLKFNFHKYQFVQARRRIDLQYARARDLDHLESLWRRVTESKNSIVRANLRLVVSVARKHLRPQLSLMELISDGNITLMRAVESFDVHLGHRFSTYATLALMKGFARSVSAMLSAQRGTRQAMLADVADKRWPNAPQRFAQRDEVRSLLGRLDDRERAILRDHFGLGEKTPLTYEQVGRQLGLSKQRVRQIERAALAKLRAHVDRSSTRAS